MTIFQAISLMLAFGMFIISLITLIIAISQSGYSQSAYATCS